MRFNLVVCIFSAVVLSSFSPVFSEVSKSQLTLEKQVRELKRKVEESKATSAMGNEVIETTSASPSTLEHDWFGSVSVLFWHPKVEGTAYAYSSDYPAGTPQLKGQIKEVRFDWDWGFKVGLGKLFDHDRWSASVEFTRLKGADSSKLAPESPSHVFPNILEITYFDSARSEAKISFLNLDLDLSRHYFLSRALSLKPSVGLKNTWLDFSQSIEYSGNTQEIGEFNSSRVLLKSDMWGIGPKLGLNSCWYLDRGLHVYGNFSTSLLYSYFKTPLSWQRTPNPPSVVLDYNRHRFIPTGQFNLGLGWRGQIEGHESIFIESRLGYECSYYWRANQTLTASSPVGQNVICWFNGRGEDISFHGVTFLLRVFY